MKWCSALGSTDQSGIFLWGDRMSKRLFILFLCGVIAGSVVADQQEILSSIVRELEGVQEIVRTFQDMAVHICPIIDQEVAAVDPKMSYEEASWQVRWNVSQAVVAFAWRPADPEICQVFNERIDQVPMEIEDVVMNAVDRVNDDFAVAFEQITDIKVAGEAMKEYYKKISAFVFQELKKYYPTLDESILN